MIGSFRKFLLPSLLCCAGLICTQSLDAKKLITENPSPEAQKLYGRLCDISGKGILFGHHFTSISGRDFTDWGQTMSRSDVLSAVGDYPAIFSFDFGQGMDRILPAVKKAGELGAVITISYHMENPFGDSNSSYCVVPGRNEVAAIMPGGIHHGFLLDKLDQIADFAQKATVKGRKIPIIFRPWHEHTGDWFWWGAKSCSEEEFIALWRFTVDYLRKEKRADNLLYAFSPSCPADYGGYGTRNPGPDYFDIAGFDCYRSADFTEVFIKSARETVTYAEKHGKLPAATEFGYKKGLQNSLNSKWFTEAFLSPLEQNPLACKLSYAVTWTNRSSTWWVPLKGDLPYKDFVDFYNAPYSLFLKEWADK
ncbi:mannan endo-1,4-beta-mannosidase [Bacteroidia bacterium]|nr:mannan endo-1,4-beta-mannosidase [Bacteroidia bacterium]